MAVDLQERKRRILKAIIESYIDTAEPVGSKLLAGSFAQSISSATIRNEMSELEEMGYLEKPHVSAGRVPSYAAYRFYVNELMDRHATAAAEVEQLRCNLQEKMRELDNMLITASKVISEMTNHTAVSMIKRNDASKVKKCELITADEGYSYAVVLLSESSVKNRMFRMSTPIEPSTATMLSTAINMAISEQRLAQLLPFIAQSMGTQSTVYEFCRLILEFVEQVESEGSHAEVYVEGAARMLGHREYQDAQRAREVLEYIADQNKMQRLMSVDFHNLVNVRIGPELEQPSMRDTSFVYSTYPIDEHTQGVVGIIAPTRMDYATVCLKLSAFAQAMGQLSRHRKPIENTGEQHEKKK